MKSWMCCLSIALLLAASVAPAHAARVWTASDATATLTLDDATLESFGLRIADSRTTGEDVVTGLDGRRHAFAAADVAGLRFRSEGGRFQEFLGGPAVMSFRGGLAIQAEHPVRKDALTPAFLYDFVLEIDPARGRDPISLRPAGSPSSPVQVRNAGFLLDEEHGILSIRMGDLQISPEWAAAAGQPQLAGQWIGGFDLQISAMTASPRDEVVRDELGTDPASTIDVTLAELYGIVSQGHIGTYPNGTAGLSAATTSCNTGTEPVPWNAPMAETHPFIALALFREQNGILEMLGKNWIKHGFFALSNDQCDLGCVGPGGSQLGVGCSDTYSAGNNGSRFYLGPREEVDPFTATWVACGSFFDEPVVPDGDCARDYNGSEPDGVAHRLEVQDADLNLPGATYTYEGQYYVANDTKRENNVGWRECTMSWSGSNWSFSTVGGGLAPNPGLVVETWGDASERSFVGMDDGEVIVSVQVTDIGGGIHHYEYALYNWRSARAVHSLSIPVGSANISNIDFRDIDQDAGNDWTATLAGGVLTFATDDYATDPDANALEYQTLFNCRFDCDAAPVASEVSGLAFRPGTGDGYEMAVDAPSAPISTAAPDIAADAERGLLLTANEPNPFSNTTRLSFSLPRPQEARVTVHDIAGRTVRVLFDDVASAGETSLRWDGRDTNGSEVASGVYFFRLRSPDGARAVKATLRR